jgi:hypothetical protein
VTGTDAVKSELDNAASDLEDCIPSNVVIGATNIKKYYVSIYTVIQTNNVMYIA